MPHISIPVYVLILRRLYKIFYKKSWIICKLIIKLEILEVPGIHEIPVAIRKNIKKFDGFVALGCVIKGETPHYDLICSSTFNALMSLSIKFNKPIGNGIVTALNLKQAKQRSNRSVSTKPNKGHEAAKAVISILKNEPKKI